MIYIAVLIVKLKENQIWIRNKLLRELKEFYTLNIYLICKYPSYKYKRELCLRALRDYIVLGRSSEG
jgi:hypothetical protein